MRRTPERGPKPSLPCLVLVQFLVQSLPVPCLSFSRGASGSSCARMVPGHVHAHPHDPALSHVTLHTSSMHYLPGHLLTVTVRSSRDFMGFLLQARSAARPALSSHSQIQGQSHMGPSGVGPGGMGVILSGGAWTLTPPGTHTIRCVSDGDTVTHSDKQLKRNLSFVWRAPDRPMGDVRFHITVVQSYFVYWTGIPSPVLHDGTRSRWRGNPMMQVQAFDEGSIQDEEELTNAINATTKSSAMINDTTTYKRNTTPSRFQMQNKTTPSAFLLTNTRISTDIVKTKANDKYGTNDAKSGTFVRSEILFVDKATQTNTDDIDSNGLASKNGTNNGRVGTFNRPESLFEDKSTNTEAANRNGLASIFSAMGESVFSNVTRDTEANILPMTNATIHSALLRNAGHMGGEDAKQDSKIRSKAVQTALPKSYNIWNETDDNTTRENQPKIVSFGDAHEPKLGKSMTKTNTTLVQDSTSAPSQSQTSPLDINFEISQDEFTKLLLNSTQTPQTTSLNTVFETKTSTTSSSIVNSTNENSSYTTQNTNITKMEPTKLSSATESGQNNLLQRQLIFSSTLSDVTATSYLQNQTYEQNVDAQRKIVINPPTNRANRDELLVTPKSSPFKSIKDLLLHLDSLLAEKKNPTPTSIAEATTSEVPSNLMATSKVSQTFSNSKALVNLKLFGSTSISVSNSSAKITTESNYSTNSPTKPVLNQALTSPSPHSPRNEVKQRSQDVQTALPTSYSSIHPKSTSSPIPMSKINVISSKFSTNMLTNSNQKASNSAGDITSSPSTFYVSQFPDNTIVPTSPLQNMFSRLTTKGPVSKSSLQSNIIVSTSRYTPSTSSNESRPMQNDTPGLNSEPTKLFPTSPDTTHSTSFASQSSLESISQDSRSPRPNNSISNLNQKTPNSSKLTMHPTSPSTVQSTIFAPTSTTRHSLQTTRTNNNSRVPISEHVTPFLQNPTAHKKNATSSHTSPLYTFGHLSTTRVRPRSTTLLNGTTASDTTQPTPLNSILTTNFLSSSNHRPSSVPFRVFTKSTHQHVRFQNGETSSAAPKDTTLDPIFQRDFNTDSNDDIGLIYFSKSASKHLSTKVTTNVPTSSIGGSGSNILTTADLHLSTIVNSFKSAKMSTKTSDFQDKETAIAPEVTKMYSSTNLQHGPTFKFHKRMSSIDFAHSNISLGQNSSHKSKDTMTEHTKNLFFFNTTYSTKFSPESSTDRNIFDSKPSASASQSTKLTTSATPTAVHEDSTVSTNHSVDFYQTFSTSIKGISIASRSPSTINSLPNVASNRSSARILNTSSKLANHSPTIAITNTIPKTSLESIGIPATSQASVHSLITVVTKKPRTNEAKPKTIGPIEQYNTSSKFTDVSNTNKTKTGLLADNLTTFAAISNKKQVLERTNDPTRGSFSGTQSFKLNSSQVLPNVSTINFQKTLLERTTMTHKELFSSTPSGSILATSDTVSHEKLVIGKNAERPITTDFQSSNSKSDSSISTGHIHSNSSPITIANHAPLLNLKSLTIGPKSQSLFNHSSFYTLTTSSSPVSKANKGKNAQTTNQYSSKFDSSTVFTTLEDTTIGQINPLTDQMLSSKNTRQTPSIVSKSTVNGRTSPKMATNFSQNVSYFLNAGTKSSSTRLDGKNITPASPNANLYQRLATNDEATIIVPILNPIATTLYQKLFTTLKNTIKISPISRFSKMHQSQTLSNAPTSINLSKSPTIVPLINNVSTTNTENNKIFTNSTKSITHHFPYMPGILRNKTWTVTRFPDLPTPLPISSPPFVTAQTYIPPKVTSSTSSYTLPNKSDSSPLKMKPSAARQSFLNHITTFKPTLGQKPLIDDALPNHSVKPNPAISRISQNTNQNAKPKVEVKAKLPPNLHPDRGGKYPDIVPRHSAWELGMLLGCSAGLGMVLVVGIRYVHRKACGKRTQVTLNDREREYSRGERGLIHLQECGDLVRVRRIRENSFVLLAEYDILATPGD